VKTSDVAEEVAQEANKTDVTVPTTNSPKNLSAGASWAAQAVQAARDAMAMKEEANGGNTHATLGAPAVVTGHVGSRLIADSNQTIPCPVVESAPEVIREYFVDNSVLQAQTPGLGYRRTKSSSDRVENVWEPWGKVVKGVDEGDWLKVGKLFLPKTLGGIVVLHSKEKRATARSNGYSAPQYVDHLMSWPTCSDLATDATSSHCSASSSVRSAGEASVHETPRKVPVSEFSSSMAFAACPSHGWQYLDQMGNVQGPFSLDEMRHWNKKGYFRADLLMRCHPEDSFSALAALFPAPLVPFQSHPRRPRRHAVKPQHESPR